MKFAFLICLLLAVSPASAIIEPSYKRCLIAAYSWTNRWTDMAKAFFNQPKKPKLRHLVSGQLWLHYQELNEDFLKCAAFSANQLRPMPMFYPFMDAALDPAYRRVIGVCAKELIDALSDFRDLAFHLRNGFYEQRKYEFDPYLPAMNRVQELLISATKLKDNFVKEPDRYDLNIIDYLQVKYREWQHPKFAGLVDFVMNKDTITYPQYQDVKNENPLPPCSLANPHILNYFENNGMINDILQGIKNKTLKYNLTNPPKAN